MAAPATRDPFLAAPHAAPGSSPPTLNAAPGGFLGLEGGGGGWAATLSPSYPLRPSVRPSVGPSVPPVGCRLPPAEKLPGPEIGRAGSDPPGFKGVWWCAAPPPPRPPSPPPSVTHPPTPPRPAAGSWPLPPGPRSPVEGGDGTTTPVACEVFPARSGLSFLNCLFGRKRDKSGLTRGWGGGGGGINIIPV